MITLIKKGLREIIKLFYENKNSKFHLREISRKTKMNENSVFRFLKELEEAQILTSKKIGNLKQYSVLKNEKTYSLFLMKDIEKYLKIEKIRKKAIDYFIKDLKKNPEIILLFGSTAKENYASESDVDLILIGENKIDFKNSEEYAESQTGIKINSRSIRFKDFQKEIKLKEDKTVQAAISSGYPLSGHLLFYQEILK